MFEVESHTQNSMGRRMTSIAHNSWAAAVVSLKEPSTPLFLVPHSNKDSPLFPPIVSHTTTIPTKQIQKPKTINYKKEKGKTKYSPCPWGTLRSFPSLKMWATLG